jgi:diacylglycerol O-acyltransferase
VTSDGTATVEARLSHADAARWYMATPENPMVITALVILEERLSLKSLADLVQGKLLRLPRFRQRVVETAGGGDPRWQAEETFELGAHVRRLVEAAPVGEEELARIAGERMSAPLPAERSPWMIELVDLATGGSALVVRIHHGIADGQALVAVLGELADRPPPRGSAGAPRAATPDRALSLLGSVAGLGRLVLDADDPATPLRGSLRGDKRVAWSRPMDLAAAKAVARGSGHHLIDVLLAAVSGALARYLRHHGVDPVDVRGLMPIAAPSAGSRKLGNHYASVSINLPVTEPDPARRMALVADEVIKRRSRSESQLAAALLGLVGAVAPGLERRAVRWRARKVSLVVSSLRGPDQKVRLAGACATSIIVWAPAPASVALSLALFGYGDELRLGVAADAGVIEDPDRIAAAFEAEMAALLAGARPAS